MSLIGSLEDLSLGDVLQIISLSQKSGLLLLQSSKGAGRIVFRNGFVCAASVKGGVADFRALMVGGGFVDEAAYETALCEAAGDAATLESLLGAVEGLSPERLAAMRRETVEAAVVDMFGWNSGEFSFEVDADDELDAESLVLSPGINAQYLAMEGLRVRDESDHAGGGAREHEVDPDDLGNAFSDVSGDASSSAHEEILFGESQPVLEIDSLEAEDDVALDDFAEAVDLKSSVETAKTGIGPLLDSVDAAMSDEVPRLGLDFDATQEIDPDTVLAGPVVDAVALATAAAIEPIAEILPQVAPEAAAAPLPEPAAVIVIDPDLHTAEWLKQALKKHYDPVHIFQRPDLGLTRIRQYLARAELPLVLVSPEIEGDPMGGIRDAQDFVARLRKQSPRMCVLWSTAIGEETPLPAAGSADGVVSRPTASELRNPRSPSDVARWTERLREEIREARASKQTGRTTRAAVPEMNRLKQVTDSLGAASARGEVLPLVLAFAGDSFARVALFSVTDGGIQGLAAQGLDREAGPTQLDAAAVQLGLDDSIWCRRVLATRAPIRVAASEAGDPVLTGLLGSPGPRDAYLAPLSSGGRVVALLYGDQWPDATPIGDTSALEVVLQHAGLALERTALERALETRGDG